MKFWNWLRFFASSIFVGLLVTLWWAHDPSTTSSGAQQPAPREAPIIVR